MIYIVVITLIIFSALFSGLTLGLMSLSAHELKRKVDLGDELAARVYPLRKQGNLLLTTLLVGNVAVNAALSIFLGTLASGLVAAIVATALIVIFGEIIPQSIFSRFALSLGARFAWLMQALIYIFYPVTKPIAWMLDKALGDELPTIYSKKELVKIIEEHEDASLSDVDEDEERIITGALTFSDTLVEDVMTPRKVVFSFEESQIINDKLLSEIVRVGHSRFPVYSGDKDNVVGILYSKHLIGDKTLGKEIKAVMQRGVQVVTEDESLDDALDIFLKTHKHIAIVKDEFGGVSGVITLEDIIEEILKKEIVDESDVHDDMREFAKEAAQHE